MWFKVNLGERSDIDDGETQSPQEDSEGRIIFPEGVDSQEGDEETPEYVDGDQQLQYGEEGGEEESQNSSTTHHSGRGEENHSDWSQERAMPLEVNPPVDPGDIFISEKWLKKMGNIKNGGMGI